MFVPRPWRDLQEGSEWRAGFGRQEAAVLCARPGALHLSMLSSTLEQQIQSAPTVWDISTHGTTSSRTAELLWGDPAVCPDTHTGIPASPHLCWPLSVQVRGSCPAETPTGQGPVLGRAGSDQYWEEILSSSSCCFQITVGCYSTRNEEGKVWQQGNHSPGEQELGGG